MLQIFYEYVVYIFYLIIMYQIVYIHLSSMTFCFCCLTSISRRFFAFFRPLSFFFQSTKTSITLRRAISAAILHFCRICSARFLCLIFIILCSSCLINFNSCNLRTVLCALSLCFRIFNSFSNSCCCTRCCLPLANFSLSLNLTFP